MKLHNKDGHLSTYGEDLFAETLDGNIGNVLDHASNLAQLSLIEMLLLQRIKNLRLKKAEVLMLKSDEEAL